jgi:hypothetical protein
MRRLFVFLAAAGAGFGIASCNCGGSASFSCRIDQDCPTGQTCQNGFCAAGNRDGGGNNPDSGNNGQDSGTPPPHDSGIQTLPDGGTCVGLQCNQVSCPGGGTTSISGTVLDPSGQLPLYDVFVYVPNGPVTPFTPGVSCTSCGATISGYPVVIALTDPKGNFTLNNMPVGTNIPLVIQIGRWRRQTVIPSVTACTNTPVATSLTTMPSSHTQGDIPLIALSSGTIDAFECLLDKMNLTSEFSAPGAGGRINFFHTNGASVIGGLGGTTAPDGKQLYDSLAALQKYDVVILPCEGGADGRNSSTVKTSQETKNIVDYTNDGGRVFTTHYGYEWIAGGPAYPPVDTVPQPFPSTADWTVLDSQQPNNQTNLQVTLNQGFTKGAAFTQWLQNIGAASNGIFQIQQARYDVGKVNASAPAYAGPTVAWMFGDPTGNTAGAPPNNYSWTPHMTFDTPYNPPPLADGDAGTTCGRVVYSDFHVTLSGGTFFPTVANKFECTTRGQPFTPQEAALVFMLFDLSSCVGANGQPPPLCSGINGSCKNDGDCCAGLSCETSTGSSCNGAAGCVCVPPLG